MAECEEKKVIMASIKALSDIVEDEKAERKTNTADIQKLQIDKGVSDEKIDQVFKILKEIKDAIQVKNERLPNFIYSVGGAIAGGTIVGVLLWLITR